MTFFARKHVINTVIACAIVAIASLPFHQPAYAEPDQPGAGSTIHLPITTNRHWPSNPFGIESHSFANSAIQTRARELGGRWIRLNGVSWWKVQPNQGDAYNWSALAKFEQELLASVKLGLTPIVTINRSPRWATVIPDACGAVRSDRFVDLANFMEALVARYSKPPFNVRHWELFNEVDVEFELVPVKDGPLGCWGDRNDPYFGGRHYGNMLKVVYPAIKRANNQAKVLAGAFILISPNSQTPYIGKPEQFLPGMLEAGAAPYFDILSFHSHGWYWLSPYQDNAPNNDWAPYGSSVDAKAHYFKQVLNKYGITKPLFMNESAFICPDIEGFREACLNPPQAFFDEQANFVIRGYSSALAAGVEMIAWYTIEEQGWNHSGLLDTSNIPRPVFKAYKTLIEQISGAQLPAAAVDYGEGVRGWRFNIGNRVVDVVYTSFLYTGPKTISWPAGSHIAMYDRFGQSLTPNITDGNATYSVNLQPIFIHRKP